MKHIHQYKRINLSKNGEYIVYRCILPDCSHYVPLALAMNKLCLCNSCGNEMRLDKYTILGKRVNPKCENCRGVDKEEINPFEEFIK